MSRFFFSLGLQKPARLLQCYSFYMSHRTRSRSRSGARSQSQNRSRNSPTTTPHSWFLAIIVNSSRPKKPEVCIFTKFRFFYSNLFHLEHIDLGSPKLHTIEIFNQTTSHKNLVILALTEDELAGGGGQILPLFPGA